MLIKRVHISFTNHTHTKKIISDVITFNILSSIEIDVKSVSMIISFFFQQLDELFSFCIKYIMFTPTRQRSATGETLNLDHQISNTVETTNCHL